MWTPTLDLIVKSRNPNLPGPVAAEKVQQASPELAEYLSKKYGKTKVVITRKKGLPVDPFSIGIVVGFIFEHVAGTVIDEMTKDTYEWLKKKIAGVSVTLAKSKALPPRPKHKPKKR